MKQWSVTLFAVSVGLILVSCEGLLAFSLDSVSVLPSSQIPIGVEAQFRMIVFTLQSPGFTYKPTEVEFSPQFNKFLINLYPDDGVKAATGAFAETVSLGVLPLGEYVYEVQVFPNREVNGGRRILFGSFTVGPQLKIERTNADLVLRWPSIASGYSLQTTGNPSDSLSWRPVAGQPTVIGSEFVWTNRISATREFYRLFKVRGGGGP